MYEVFVPDEAGQVLGLSDVSLPIRENFDLAPANILLSAVPEKLAGVAGRENILATALNSVRDRYDYVVVDCAPSVGLLTFNAVKACSEAIVPMDPSFFSLHGIGKVMETFDLLEKETGHHVTARVLVTLYTGRSPFVKAVLDEVRDYLPGRYYQTFIRYSVKLAEAASHGLPIAQYCRQCVGFEDYQELSAEVLQQEQPVPTIEDNSSEVLEVSVNGNENGNWNWIGSGTAITAEGVVFSVEAPGAERVQLVGDFNEWGTEDSEMERVGRVWRKVVNLHPGRYQYRFVVDGQWLSDPSNSAQEPCPGGYNSVLHLDEKSAETYLN